VSRVIDLSRTVYELSRENPDIVDIMKDIGFESIVNPGMLNTAGRIMTIPKGAAMKGISMERIKEALQQKGYQVIEYH
jgi:N-dimethylarginine dimethylaminohydrolase